MVKYEDVKNLTTEQFFNGNDFSIDAFNKKYTIDKNETYVQALKRVCDFVASVEKTDKLKQYWSERWFDEIFEGWWHPAGSIMQGAGSGRKISLANCFSSDTEFITDKGVKTFDNFLDGDSVNVLTNYGGYKPATIKSFGCQKLYNLTVMRNGIYKEIKCTIDHIWRTLQKDTVVLKKTGELQINDLLPYVKRKSMGDGADATNRYFCPIGFIHGLVYGNGYYNKEWNFCSLDLCGDSKQFIRYFKGFNWKISEQDDRIRISYLPNYMKEMPNFDKINTEYILGFIIGWFAADGTIDSGGRAALYHNNLDNLIKIKKVLESVGIYSSEIQTKRETNDIEIQGKKYHSEKGYNLYSLYFIKDTLYESFFAKESHKNNYINYVKLMKKDKSRVQWKVVSIDETDLYEPVWCVVEPETQNFTLSGGLNTHNCTTISMGAIDEKNEWDNLESIFKNTAYTVAKTAAYRQGLGVDFSRLRPKGSSVLNSANESAGAIHWMKLIDSIGYYVGQKGRIPAMLFSLNIKHPDIEEFITVKSDYTKIQNANLSVQITNNFYTAIYNNDDWDLSFDMPEIKKGQKIYLDEHSIDRDTIKEQIKPFREGDFERYVYYKIATHDKKSERITKKIKARKLLELIAENMFKNAEPGIQNIDIAREYSNSDAVYDQNDEYDSRIISTNAPLVGNTYIPTKNGLYQIENLYEAGDSIVIADTISALPNNFLNYKNTRNYKSFKTSTFGINGKFKKYENQIVYEIETEGGPTLKCNGEHKWLTENGMISTHELKIGNKIFQPSDGILQSFDLEINKNEDYIDGQLIGYFVGDGYFGKESDSHKLMFGILFDYTTTYFKNLFKNKFKSITGNDINYESKSNKISYMRTENIKFLNWIKSFGFNDDKYFIPNMCYINKEFCAGFMNGLFYADGYFGGKNHRYIDLVSVNKKLILDIQLLLSSWFGIHSKYKENTQKPVKYILSDGTKKISKVKEFRYDLIISNHESHIKFKKYISSADYKLDSLNDLCDIDVARINNRLFFKIKNIIKTERKENMYCAVVDGMHSFVAQGCISSNCSEQYLSRESLCVLASENVERFSTNVDEYKVEQKKIAESMQRFLDNVNECELVYYTYATPHQKLAIRKLRRTGAGITNIGGWLFKQNMEYGSIDGNDAMENFMKWYNYSLYKANIALGAEKGNFELFDAKKIRNSKFIKEMIAEFPDLKFETLRCVTSSSIAPTGTLSLMFRKMILSYGIENGFGIYYWKRTRISGKYEYYFVVPNIVREVFKAAGYEIPIKSDTIKDTWDGKYGEPIAKFIDDNKDKIGIKFKNSADISPFDKLELMSKIMKWVDSSISVTYLLPESTSTKKVYDFILEAHKKGVKSIAAFPDKKMYGIISDTSFKKLAYKLKIEGVEIHPQNFTPDELKELHLSNDFIVATSAPKRPNDLDADIYSITVSGEKFVVAIGLLNGAPYEMFAGKMNGLNFKFKEKKGVISKVKKGVYSLSTDDFMIEDFSNYFKPAEATIFRMVSTSLRHGVPLKFVVEQLSKSSDNLGSLTAAASRVLKKYIKDGEIATGMKCPSCGAAHLIYDKGCVSCSCGWSKCD